MSMKQKGKAVLNPGTVDEVWGLCDDIEIGDEADKEQFIRTAFANICAGKFRHF